MDWKTLGSAALGLAITLVGGNAWAGGYCSDKVPCKLATDTCHGGYCVPSAKLCTGTPSCASWQKCDFTCPWGGVSSTEPVPGPTPGETDAGSSGGGSGGSGSADAGAGAKAPMPPQDAGGAQEDPAPPEQDGGSTDGGTTTVPANCPKDLGVCIADPVKVPAQPGCEAFCAAAMACNFGESSGGSGGSGGGSTPPSPGVDAGSGEDPDGKKGFAPKPEDAGSSEDQATDASMAPPPDDAGGVPQPWDGGSTDGDGGQPDELAQCVLMCSIWKLEKVAPAELMNLEQCVVVYKDQCDTMKAKCEPLIEPFMTKAMADDSWQLGLGGFMGSDGGNPPKEGGDAMPVDMDAGNLPGGDASTGGDAGLPQGGDDSTGGAGGSGDAANTTDAPGTADAGSTSDGVQAGDAASGGGTGSAPAKADSGCTAGTGPSGNPAGLAGLGMLLAAALWLRRRAA